MNFNIKNGILEMQGFDIGNKILISDALEILRKKLLRK